MDYVVGFLIDRVAREVVLVKKNRPQWQAGKYNGVGGKIEVGESPSEAMRREFREETGHERSDWERFAVLTGGEPWDRGSGFNVHFFRAFESNLRDAVTTATDERIEVMEIGGLGGIPHVPNLDWLIPMALKSEEDCAGWFVVREMYA